MKYTNEQLKEMATEFLCAYNLSDHRADVMLHLLCQVTNTPPERIISEINKLADYKG